MKKILFALMCAASLAAADAFCDDDNDVSMQEMIECVENAEEYLKNADACKPSLKMAECACITDDVRTLKKMEKNGFSRWNAPKLISYAVLFGNTNSCRFLLSRGADANTLVDTKFIEGISVLSMAASGENFEIVKLLVSKGADVNAEDENGMTALVYAAEGGSLEICRLLVEAGADVNGEDGITALSRAYANDYTDIVEYLKSVGAK